MPRPNPAQTFLTEAEDLLSQIEEITLEVRPGAPAGEAVNHLFRAFHTIKGSGAMFGFDAIATFTHHVETVLDKVRDGAIPVSQQLIDLILASKDQIKFLLDAAQGGPAAPPDSGLKLVTDLKGLLSPQPAQALPPDPSAGNTQSGPNAGSAAPTAAPSSTSQVYRILFTPPPNLMVSGTNPRLLLDELRGLGVCTVRANPQGIPPLEQLQADQCYLSWEIRLTTDKGLNAIQDVFIFVQDGSGVKIEPVISAAPAAALPASAPAPSVIPEPSRPAAGAATSLARKAISKDASVRVPSERLDRLVTLVGEMVMNQSRLTQVAAAAGLPNLAAPVEELERLVDELRDNVLGIRMMPIGATFNRFKRLVHDLSAELGKEIELVTEGAETELDKTVLDQLGDPLVHLIRNCIDHGIEPMETREKTGKPRQGTVRLAAAHTGSNVVITIQDDGRGLDLEAIRAKALEKKLIAPDTAMSREEIYNLIFLPGFSTAKQVTNVSGRGVGMDVVKRQMDNLRGTIQLASDQGQSTTVSLTLPLTLAIIDGLLVEIGRDQFIIPMSAVTENVELPRAERALKNARNLTQVRGELVPYIHLREVFCISGEEPPLEKIVIVRHGNDRVGLVVDRVLGSHQTVIQSLGRFYRHIDVVSGATIMGDGRVALILDLPGVVRAADRSGPGLCSQINQRPINQ